MSEPTRPLSNTFEVPLPYQVVVPVPRVRRAYWVHVLLLVLTFFTTLVVGARLQYNFAHNLPPLTTDTLALPLFPIHWIWQQPARLLLGLPFSLTLMGILLAHEMGHFVLCVKNRVYATLPYFIPAPTLIGTLGAFIRIKSPIRSRRALLDIGIAGPIAGFLVAVPVLFWGLALSKPMPVNAPSGGYDLGFPLIFDIVRAIIAPMQPGSSGAVPLDNLFLHPIAIAAWVGMFATALNLLPGGQLDGGHIIYAFAPNKHKWVTRFTVVALVPLAYFCWVGWLLWAIILALTGWRHPRVPAWPELDPRRRQFALVALLLLVLTLAISPFHGASLREVLRDLLS